MKTIAIPKLGPGLQRLYYRYLYESALAAVGAKVHWIGPENIGSVNRCDGLLIPGGDDVEPGLYGQTKSEKCGKQNPLRDRLDPAIMKAFFPTGKPILGICRGMQMLNVHLGGTLHQDIKGSQAICHQQASQKKKTVHDVQIGTESLLRSIVKSDRLAVNSLHHQAVDALAPGLRICARSEDGIIEAVELPSHPFCLAVQWHPEMLSRKHDGHKAILEAFIQACQ